MSSLSWLVTIILISSSVLGWPNPQDPDDRCVPECEVEYEAWMAHELCRSCEEQCVNKYAYIDRDRINCRAKCVEAGKDTSAIPILDAYMQCVGIKCDAFFTYDQSIFKDRAEGRSIGIDRVQWDDISTDIFINQYLKQNKPIILTGVVDQWAAFNLSYLQRDVGIVHTIQFPDLDVERAAASNFYPFTDRFDWPVTGLWGGMVGHGASRHADKTCEIYYAAQLIGAKYWRVHWVSPTTNNLGKNVYGDLVFEGLVSAGDLLVFTPWLPHETVNYYSTSQSIHGAVNLKGDHKGNRNPLGLLFPPRCALPVSEWHSSDEL